MNMKPKKIVSFLTALVLISGGTCFPETNTSIFNVSTNVSAASTYGDLTYEITNEEITITSCDKSVTEVEIPSEIEGYPVTAIGGYAFGDCQSLASINIPNSVTSIGTMAFYRCTGLTSVTIPNSVTFIADNSFANCPRLTSINIPDSVNVIGTFTFVDCDGLTSVTIPDSVTYIMNYAFYNCTSLTSVTIPKSVEFIGELSLGYNSSGKQIENFKIYGYLNSAAESYAKTNGFEFIDIESEPIVTTPTPSILYGDANMDNKIDNVDLVTLCQALTKEIVLDSAQILRSDLNNDGAIDVSDAAILKQYILGDKVTLGPKK